jgi:hypothetical protein
MSGPAYEQLERVRNVLRNAEFNPLPDAAEQRSVVMALEIARDTYRAAHDRAERDAAVIGYKYDDGGRKAAGFAGSANDCVTRAIAIATGRPYAEVYAAINALAKRERPGSKRRNGRRSSARTGVFTATTRRYMESIGWRWVPTMQIGSGCKVHLRASELPRGRLVVKVTKHCVAVIDGVIHDTHDCARDGTRCVYGYYVEGRK